MSIQDSLESEIIGNSVEIQVHTTNGCSDFYISGIWLIRLIDGRIESIGESNAIQQSAHSEKIRNLQLSLEQAQGQNKQLRTHYERALAASKLGEPKFNNKAQVMMALIIENIDQTEDKSIEVLP